MLDILEGILLCLFEGRLIECKYSKMLWEMGRKNRSGQVFDNNGNEMFDFYFLSLNLLMKSCDVFFVLDNELWVFEDLYFEELLFLLIQWKFEILWIFDCC